MTVADGQPKRRTSEELTEHYQWMVQRHGNDPVTGACLICGQHRCSEYNWARSQLILAGKW